MAPAIGSSINGEFKVKELGAIAWMCNLATQTTLTSSNRGCRGESGSGNPSHEPSSWNQVNFHSES